MLYSERCFLLLFSTALFVFGQSTTGTITGFVADPSGAAVIGARIEVRHAATNAVVAATTSAQGSYTVPSLIPGAFEITVVAAGFKNARASGVVVYTAQTTTQNFRLEVGQLTETIQVTAEVPLITPNTAAVTTTIENKILQDLPFPDRSMLAVALLTPGAQGDPQYNGGVQSELPGIWTQPVSPGVSISIGGGRPGGGSILVDGSDVTSAGFARAVMTFSGDTVQEVSVQANGIPAQYGRTTSGIINQSTKSGTNSFHGSASWAHMDPFFQTRALGAAIAPTNRYNQYAAAIGGPVVIPKLYDGRNKTFFWATGEPQRMSLLWAAQRTRLPTKDELAGRYNNSWDFLDPALRQQDILAAINSPVRTNQLRHHYNLNPDGFPMGEELPTAQRPVIPNNDLSNLLAKNPMAQGIISQVFPYTPGVDTAYLKWLRPDGLWDSTGNNAIFARGTTSEDNRWSVKLDHLVGANDRFAVRYSTAPVTGTRFDWGGPADPSAPLPQDDINSKNAGLTHTHIFSAALVNEFRLTYSRGNAVRGQNNAGLSRDWGKELGLLPAVSGVGFPSVLGRGYNGDGQNHGRSIDVNLGLGNDLSWVRGRHNLKFGGEHRRIQLNRLSYGGLTGGAYNFTNQITPNSGSIWGTMNHLGGLITGSLNNYAYKRVQTNAYYRWRYLAAYLQDDFKLTSALTLQLGLRWDLETPRTEKYDRQGSFDPNIAGTVNGVPVKGAFVFAGRNGRPRTLWPVSYRGFQPRLGVAYAARPWMSWRASFNVLRAPITGAGLDIFPDININANTVSSASRTGGVQPGPINLITNPIGPLAPAKDVGREPIFFMNNTNSFPFTYIPQSGEMPYVLKWNAGTQLMVSNSMSVEIGYDASRGVHLFNWEPGLNTIRPEVTAPLVAQGKDFNTLSAAHNSLNIANSDGALIRGRLIDSLRPYPNWFNNRIDTSYNRSGSSIYHALIVGFQQRFASGLTVQGSYSFSKSIDDASSNLQTSQVADVFGIVNAQAWDRRLERSLSTFHIPHKFSLAYTYELPFGSGKWIGGGARGLAQRLIGGWNISGMFKRQSGYPVTAYLGSAGWFSSTGGGTGLDFGTLRPDINPGVPLVNPAWRESPFDRGYLNPEAFLVPGDPQNPRIGNAPRTLGVLTPVLTSWDAAMFKEIRFTHEGKRYLQLRADVFNVANHPNFFVNPGRGNAGAYSFNANTRTFTPNKSLNAMDANNTGQFNNYAGRSFRLGARIYF